MYETSYGQREFMRKLVGSLGYDQYEVCTAYAEAEIDGKVRRKKNAGSTTPEEYAMALWRDGEQKGWLQGHGPAALSPAMGRLHIENSHQIGQVVPAVSRRLSSSPENRSGIRPADSAAE